jgi:hypothetical protein
MSSIADAPARGSSRVPPTGKQDAAGQKDRGPEDRAPNVFKMSV